MSTSTYKQASLSVSVAEWASGAIPTHLAVLSRVCVLPCLCCLETANLSDMLFDTKDERRMTNGWKGSQHATTPHAL